MLQMFRPHSVVAGATWPPTLLLSDLASVVGAKSELAQQIIMLRTVARVLAHIFSCSCHVSERVTHCDCEYEEVCKMRGVNLR